MKKWVVKKWLCYITTLLYKHYKISVNVWYVNNISDGQLPSTVIDSGVDNNVLEMINSNSSKELLEQHNALEWK